MSSAVASFKRNLGEVDRLINFDHELLQLVSLTVQRLHEQLQPRIADERLNGKRALDTIKGIRENETIRGKYQAIYNQAVVLLVSHFASALGDLFRQAVTERLGSEDPGKLLDEEFRLSVADLKERDWTLLGAIPDLLIAKHDYTFQDMGATVRAFSTYTVLEPRRGETMNNIIAAQACRHAIVHAGGRVTEKTVRQLARVQPRTLKPSLVVGEPIAFSLAEVETVKSEMLRFIEQLTTASASPH